MRTPPALHRDPETVVDEVLRRVGRRVVMAIALGVGKPVAFVDALVRRALAEPDLEVEILTALTLLRPRPGSDLERRLAGPILERLLGGVPEPLYGLLQRDGRLPPNVQVREFYLSPGQYLGNARVQQSYTSLNFTAVPEAMRARGLNVGAQMVTPDVQGFGFSLGANTDLSLDLLPDAREQGIVAVAQVNRRLPYMPGDAVLPRDTFDLVLDDPGLDHPLFGLPREAVSRVDHAIALHASGLVRDGGTLQVGIGSLGDAVAHALILRHRDNGLWRRAVEALAGPGSREVMGRLGDAGPFERGLYGNTEMMVDGFRHLYEAGILRRRVFDDPTLQALEDEGALPERFDAEVLARLVALGVVPARLTEAAVQHLRDLGVLDPDVRWADGRLVLRDREVEADLGDPEAREEIARRFLSPAEPGRIVHAGFFVGHPSLYEWIADLPLAERARFAMTAVRHTNRLVGEADLRIRQRRDARFLNTAMLVTLDGAVVSDGLADGRVVSGVGGQFEFVHMAHDLPGGRSVIMLRSTRTKDGEATSNLVWRYAHATIPRHLRDVVVTEYGVADVRGRSDREVIEALLSITDARFLDGLVAAAKRSKKLPKDFRVPDAWRRNTPEDLEARLAPFAAHLPEAPFGSDLTDEEQVLRRALGRVQADADARSPKLAEAWRSLRVPAAAEPYLQRMGLEAPTSLRERGLQRLVVYGLRRVGAL